MYDSLILIHIYIYIYVIGLIIYSILLNKSNSESWNKINEKIKFGIL
jgi:hypothetical protein